MRARPIATICCSPPDRLLVSWPRLFFEPRKSVEHEVEVDGHGPAVLACIGAHEEIVADRHEREDALALRHHTDAAGDDLIRPQPVDPAAVKPDFARGDGREAGHCPERRRLAGANSSQ